jgi:hypothetical protein
VRKALSFSLLFCAHIIELKTQEAPLIEKEQQAETVMLLQDEWVQNLMDLGLTLVQVKTYIAQP